MRNVFDQFQQPENRLSHALATTLAMDAGVCRKFLKWLTGKSVPGRTKLIVEQQTVPGAAFALDPDPDERRGLPDICIHSGEDWCVVIESKVAAALTADQLRRHRRTVERGFDEVRLVALTAEPSPTGLIDGVFHRTWTDVFAWMGQQAQSASIWCRQLREYMRLFEARQIAEDYPMPGPITTFDGIPFGADHLYSYREAKLLLRQAMQLLRQRPILQALGADISFAGRPAITGKDATLVWDLISLRPPGSTDDFTTWPHLTLGIREDKTEAMVTIPNGIKPRCRTALRELGPDGFIDLCVEIIKEARSLLGRGTGYSPVMRLIQRHYLGQRKGIVDGDMHADLNIAIGDAKRRVKRQPQWLTTAHSLTTVRGGANVQLQLGVWFPHEGGLLRTGDSALKNIEAAWQACRPLLAVVM